MRYSKQILIILLCAAAGGYAFVQHTYRVVEHQYMQQRSLDGKINQVLDAPFKLSQQLASELQRFHEDMFSSPNDPITEEQETSIKHKKNELAGWLQIFRWLLFGTAGILLVLLMGRSSLTDTPLMKQICALVFLALGVSTPFLSIVVESATVQLPGLKDLEPVVFYHKAKSIAGMIHSLVATSRVYEIILGILVGLFSVVLPLIKLCIVPLLPDSEGKKKVQQNLFRFAFVDVLAAGILVSFLATDQLLSANTSNSFLFTGLSRLEDGAMFFMLYLGFTAAELKNRT